MNSCFVKKAMGVSKAQLLIGSFVLATMLVFVFNVKVGYADNFTDIFYTNSFRGAFTWIKKLDWLGMLIQIVISCFSLFGVALLTIRIMTSMLYLSSKGMWEEVHDLKSSGGESEMYDFGVLNMAKSWAKGKAGTGLDAIIGAVLILLPDVKKYSDFGEKAGGKFEEDITITQYMLKIMLPTVMTVFFFAMGFNGTLFQALAVTVDAMGTVADRCVAVNYAGIAEDLANQGSGYNFVFDKQGTYQGELQQGIAKTVYGKCISNVRGMNKEQLYQVGLNVQDWVSNNITPTGAGIQESKRISQEVREGLTSENADQYMAYLGYDFEVNASDRAEGAITFPLDSSGAYQNVNGLESTGAATMYLHVFVKQSKDFNGSWFNLKK